MYNENPMSNPNKPVSETMDKIAPEIIHENERTFKKKKVRPAIKESSRFLVGLFVGHLFGGRVRGVF
jgi:hypothetical protein